MMLPLNRRAFLKSTAATGASMALLPTALGEIASSPLPGDARSRVVEVSAPGVVTFQKSRWDLDRVKNMVHEGMKTLTGKKDLAEAWKCFVKADDTVGVKLNSGAGHRQIGTKRPILDAVLEGVRLAGVPDERIIVWDQIKEYVVKGYCKRNKIFPDDTEVRYEGCAPALKREHYMEGKPLDGFDTTPIEFPWGRVKVAKLLDEMTAIINLPVLKDHACAGVTLALKNISHAIVDKPWLCHGNCCVPYIPDIVGIPAVKDKLRLHILDAILGLAEGGPSMASLDHVFVHEKMLLSADPVALDAVGCEWIVDARKKMGYVPLEQADNRIKAEEAALKAQKHKEETGEELPIDPESIKGRPATHIAASAKKGLGIADRKRIDVIPLTVEAAPEEE